MRNPDIKRFTWRQKSPPIHSRLDLLLISDFLQDYCNEVDILPAVRSDHSSVTLKLYNIDMVKGPGLWKLNNSYLKDEQYVKELIPLFDVWLKEAATLKDIRMTWEYIKYKVRDYSVHFGKKKKKDMVNTEQSLETKLKEIDEKIDQGDSDISLALERERVIKELKDIDKYKTEGLILRTKCTWYEEGEKSNKYFLRLLSRNATKTNMSKLCMPTGDIITSQKEILKMQAQYYQVLYSNNVTKDENDMKMYLKDVITPSITEQDSLLCNDLLTFEECEKTLGMMKNNKTPGNDGLTVEFYKCFWKHIGTIVVDSFNFSYEYGQLSSSQRQAVIVLLDKGKDRTLLKNWRPISILNVDYKILSKTIAERLKKVLPGIVHYDQAGFMKGRNIVDNIRTIQDVLDYTYLENIPGILISIDFEKAFDSVSWKFIEVVMREKFHFDDIFLNWIKVLYNGASSCVINNGYTSEYFPLHRGVRQGDPLSPYIFILVVEVLACIIRQNKKIEGLDVGGRCLKILQYADDTNGVVSNLKSAKIFLDTVEVFGNFSGLKLNRDKTEALWIGKCRHYDQKPLCIKWPDNPIKVLGVYLSYNKSECDCMNFEPKIAKCQAVINDWKGRNLTLLGKVQIIKTFIISQFLFVCSAITMPEKYVKKANSIIVSFMWGSGKHLLSKDVLYRRKSLGGLEVPDLKMMIQVSNIKWIKKYRQDNSLYWKLFLQHFFKACSLDVNILLVSNYNTKMLQIENKIPVFYRNAVSDWINYVECERPRCNFIWYNQNIRVQGKSLYYKDFYDVGIQYISDLYDNKGVIRPFQYWMTKGLGSHCWLKWFGLIDSVKYVHSARTNSLQVEKSYVIGAKCLEECTTKEMYIYVNGKIGRNTVHVPRICNYLNLRNPIEWDSVYMNLFNCLIDTKTKEFQYKFLHDIIVNRYWLEKWKITDTNLCRLCMEQVENIDHMFWSCDYVKQFWKDLNQFIMDKLNIIVQKEDVFLCTNNNVFNTIVVNAKRHIYRSFINEKSPHFKTFLHLLSNIIKIECDIYKRRKKLNEWTLKWHAFIVNNEIVL